MLIRRATADDALRARVTAVRAFVDDPVMRWLHPDDDIYLAPGGEVLRDAFDGWLGLGAALMGSMFERAAVEGLPCYLETETIENVAYYRHHGFEVRSEWDVPTGPHMWGMFRPA